MKLLTLSEVNDLGLGQVALYDDFFAAIDADSLFAGLLKYERDWGQEYLTIYGKQIPFPRKTGWYGDADCSYSYSGITMLPLPWTKPLQTIREAVKRKAETEFNSVLLNYYRGGTDSMSWHSDDERELGTNPIIASVSFGQERPFQLRLKRDRSVKAEILLKHGSLLVMRGALQHHWQHQVPKTKRQIEPRINLTFRYIIV